MKSNSVKYKLLILSSVSLFLISFEVIMPFYNYYLGKYSWWFCLLNVVIMVIYNEWKCRDRSKVVNSYVFRNLNTLISLFVIVISFLMIHVFGLERYYYDLVESEIQLEDLLFGEKTVNLEWVRKSISGDLFILLILNFIILTEHSIFEFLDNI